MRLKIASVLLLAGTVVGCASNPPPPPPVAAAPEPAPPAPPPVMAPVAGTYRGMATADGGKTCHAPRGNQTARVRGMVITVAGLRGTIGPDGSVTGRNLSGTVNGGTADVMVMRGKCSFHYTLTNGASGQSGMGSGSLSTGTNSGTATQ